MSPMPPAVAQNSSGWSDGETTIVDPSARASVTDSTWSHHEPARWWFLPWMSAAIAPPTVTYLVPGVTGTNQPRGTRSRMRASRLAPAEARTTPVAGSRWKSLTAVVSMTRPPAFWALSP